MLGQSSFENSLNVALRTPNPSFTACMPAPLVVEDDGSPFNARRGGCLRGGRNRLVRIGRLHSFGMFAGGEDPVARLGGVEGVEVEPAVEADDAGPGGAGQDL